MILPDFCGHKWLFSVVVPVILGVGLVSACADRSSVNEVVPERVYPDAPPLKHRHRNHSITESPDGKMRVYVAQRGDIVDLMLQRKMSDGDWSEPTQLDFPKRESNTSPRFFPDGSLYYSSDARHPRRPGRKDLNIWRVDFVAGAFGTPEVLPDVINTGSHEDSFAPLGEGRAIFSSTTLGGAGGYDLYIAEQSGGAWTVRPFPYNTAMADSHPATSPDGNVLVWYAHMPFDGIYGVVDLFVSERQGDGWSEPKNLGPVINSAGIDYGPGFSSDGERLFFSRDGVLYSVAAEPAVETAGFQALPDTNR